MGTLMVLSWIHGSPTRPRLQDQAMNMDREYAISEPGWDFDVLDVLDKEIEMPRKEQVLMWLNR